MRPAVALSICTFVAILTSSQLAAAKKAPFSKPGRATKVETKIESSERGTRKRVIRTYKTTSGKETTVTESFFKKPGDKRFSKNSTSKTWELNGGVKKGVWKSAVSSIKEEFLQMPSGLTRVLEPGGDILFADVTTSLAKTASDLSAYVGRTGSFETVVSLPGVSHKYDDTWSARVKIDSGMTPKQVQRLIAGRLLGEVLFQRTGMGVTATPKAFLAAVTGYLGSWL